MASRSPIAHDVQRHADDLDETTRGRRGVWRRVILIVTVSVISSFVVQLSGCMDRLFFYPERTATPPPDGAEGVWFESADGTRLFGWWIPASETEPGSAAGTVLHVHGNAGSISDHEYFSSHFVSGGFNVFVFDYRGYGQSEGAARRRADLISDVRAALDVVLVRSEVERNRIAVYGQSLGGALAIPALAERDEIAGLILESPFASWRRIAANAVGGDPPHLLARALATALVGDSHRAVDAMQLWSQPVLIVHGTEDEIVPHSHGRMIAEAAGDRARFISCEGGRHNTVQDTHPEVRAAMIEFLQDCFAD